MGHDYIFDRRCTGCVAKCDADQYYMCASNDHCLYEGKKEKTLYWGEKCKSCVNAKCDIDKAEKCIEADYGLYEKKEAPIKSMVVAPKPSYKAFKFTGRPSTIAEELNKFFAENSNVEVVSVTRVDGYANETASGVLMIVKM